MECDGRGDNGGPCCYVEGELCRFLTHVEGQPRCSLMLELNDWDAVHNDPRYLEHVKPVWERAGCSDCGVFGTGRDGKPLACCYAEVSDA